MEAFPRPTKRWQEDAMELAKKEEGASAKGQGSKFEPGEGRRPSPAKTISQFAEGWWCGVQYVHTQTRGGLKVLQP